MTNEEAKIWLNKLYTRTDIIDEYGDMEDMQPYKEAVGMAIKALEQESPQPNKSYPVDVLNCWIGKELLYRLRDEIEHVHDLAFNREWILMIIDRYIEEGASHGKD